ncbi:3-phosphoserine/phosphohydroxythreonine transaminase [Metabacillus sediminilitoris]|uniref:Phosphoserine aminotransferase n=1 Tax=Metabacillus sediminilitoris TaxID=2567941 RepID=A0A4S4BYC7_9BACI|nr:3-phosphoserine/phosphohydroxythreonine transaminase [Metabacillus sediminilitoris]QGQ44534.1 3-phosphoserine/phosphohydroxythreonine transaminase [Metabacillus sediminilitoris]THF80159.1 3-phosphoserine/phosphohydroxythreonine transaminase [Metabacillus sediminilitoris]
MRAYNFNAGPAAIPLPVLEKAQKELVNFQNTGMSVMELSHRSKDYEEVHNRANSLLRELLGIPDTYEVLFLQGGASLQFTMIPMNFLPENKTAHYILSGAWSEKALKEAKLFGETRILASSKEENYTTIPSFSLEGVEEDGAYVHITSNNTIYGTQWNEYPTSPIPLIADMSSDILCKEIDVEKFSLIYAGAQKNLGPSGVTVVIVKKDFLETARTNVPTILSYATHSKNNSLFNTPPTFAIYMLSLVLEWVKEQGGVKSIQKLNEEKAGYIYSAIEESDGFYKGHATKGSRSLMNITFTLPNEELTKKFLQEAKDRNFIGLAGHRSVGGCRASAYNAVPKEACEALANFMKEFKNQHK